MSLETEARAYFEVHYNCAQSTFAPFAKRFGMDEALVLKIATPFGGGMGHAGGICGAVSGALMAIGLSEGIAVYDHDKKYACYAMAKTFQERFKALHGELTCPGLLGFDIGDPDELQEVRDRDLFHTFCPNLVGDSTRIVAELLGMTD